MNEFDEKKAKTKILIEIKDKKIKISERKLALLQELDKLEQELKNLTKKEGLINNGFDIEKVIENIK